MYILPLMWDTKFHIHVENTHAKYVLILPFLDRRKEKM
jgi:hypothetical protein